MPATLPPPGDESTLYLVDLAGYVYRAYHALPPLSTAKGEPTGAIHGVLQMLDKLIAERAPKRLAVALESRGKTFRHALYDRYKHSRPEMPVDLRPQMERLRDVIAAYAIPALGVEGFEADDILATAARRARAEGLKVVVVSADKDLLQLVGDGIQQWDTMRDRVFGPEETREKMGVGPAQIRDFLALTGDSSDDVPGVPSVGPKTALTLLEKYGSLDGIYANLETIERAALREKLRAHKDDAYLSQSLVTLREDVPLPEDPGAIRWAGPDTARLRTLFQELELGRLTQKLAPAPRPPLRVRSVVDDAALEALVADVRAAGSVSLFLATEGNDLPGERLVGIALVARAGEASYVPLDHLYLGVPKQLSREQVLAALRPILEDETIGKALFDAKKEEITLGWLGVALRGVRFDAMLAHYLLDPEEGAHGLVDVAARELGEQLGSYDALTEKQRGSQRALAEVTIERAAEWACASADTVRALAATLTSRLESERLGALFREVELPLAHVLADLEHTGVLVDTEYLGTLAREVRGRIAETEQKIFGIAGHAFQVQSPKQLEQVLFDELGLPVIKKTRTGRSTDHEVLEELAAEHPLPEHVLEHRMLSKLEGTYLVALPRAVSPRDGRVHTRFNQAVAATGRLSSSEPNLQNVPIRTDLGRLVRRAFVAPPGCVVLSADYSQIELRLLAHLSGDPELLEAFRSNTDVHVRTATALFDVAPDAVTREQRGRAKTVNFAVIYGQTEFALARNLKIDRKEAQRYIAAFFARYAGVRRFLDRTVEEARRTGVVRTLLDRRRAVADLRSANRSTRFAAERIACNTPIQGSAADLLKVAMVRVHARLLREGRAARMVLTVHDELVFEVPTAELDVVRALVVEEMQGVMALDVPLLVETGVGANWGDAH